MAAQTALQRLLREEGAVRPTSPLFVATAPLPAPSPDGVEAMGRTNDAILYGGRVHLSVRGSDDAARRQAGFERVRRHQHLQIGRAHV